MTGLNAGVKADTVLRKDLAAQSQRRLELTRDSTFAFMFAYLDHLMRFKDGHPRAGEYCDSGDYGKGLCKALDRAIIPQRRLVGAIPREHAKTTIGTIGLVTRCICQQLKRNIVIVGANVQEAQDKLSAIVQELEDNPKLIADYGRGVLPKTDNRGQTIQARDSNILFNNGVRVRAVSFGSKIRGQNVRSMRVDLYVFDDPEDDISVQSETERRKMWNWFRKTVINSLQQESGSIVWLGTKLHHDSLLCRALDMYRDDPQWETIDQKAIKEDGTPLWPEKWSLEALDTRKREIGSAAFSSEYMNQPVDEETQIFKPSFWKYYRRSDLQNIGGRWYLPNPYAKNIEMLPLTIFEGDDPALGLETRHDYSAWFVYGRQENTNLVYVLEIGRGKLTTAGWLDGMERRYQVWHPARIGIENIAFQALLGQQAIQRGLPVVGVRPLSKKKERAQTAAIPFEQGRILLPEGEPATRAFTEECEFFPSGKNDDQVDALSVALEVGTFTSERVLRVERKRSDFVVRGFQNESSTTGY